MGTQADILERIATALEKIAGTYECPKCEEPLDENMYDIPESMEMPQDDDSYFEGHDIDIPEQAETRLRRETRPGYVMSNEEA